MCVCVCVCVHAGGGWAARTAIVLNKRGEDINQVLMLRLRVADSDARIEEGQLTLRRDHDVTGVEIAVYKVVNLGARPAGMGGA